MIIKIDQEALVTVPKPSQFDDRNEGPYCICQLVYCTAEFNSIEYSMWIVIPKLLTLVTIQIFIVIRVVIHALGPNKIWKLKFSGS